MSPRAIASVASALFLAHASRYLYFFVDDEAIPFVYARNLLRGRGLVYTAFEGRVEGYSDFLTVLVDTILLGLTRIAGAPTLSVFAGASYNVLIANARADNWAPDYAQRAGNTSDPIVRLWAGAIVGLRLLAE